MPHSIGGLNYAPDVLLSDDELLLTLVLFVWRRDAFKWRGARGGSWSSRKASDHDYLG
jgi:hypothetical protein